MSFQHPQLTVLQHALVQHHLSGLRSISTPSAAFRQHVRVLATLLAAEATRHLAIEPVSVTTPMEETVCFRLKGRTAVVPILRAGLGMVEPLSDLIPDIEVWHLGLYRDETTAMPVHYYDKLPADNPPDVGIVVDPMLATGGSAAMAVNALQRWGVPKILVLAIISTPEGILQLADNSPAISICTCIVDRGLNDRKYILPGLGDAGDRMFNTSGS